MYSEVMSGRSLVEEVLLSPACLLRDQKLTCIYFTVSGGRLRFRSQ